MVKAFTPPPPTITLHGHPKQRGTIHTKNSPGGVLFAIIFGLILIFLIMGLGIPVTSHFLMNDEWSPLIVRITHLAWKILIAPSPYMSDSGIQN